MDDMQLVNAALNAMQYSYSPYSKFKVGAAILTDCGKIYTGCNVENASYGAAICAERCAAVKAISDGCTKFSKIAIISSSNTYTYPCGICRQFLSEFFLKEGIVCLYDQNNGIKTIPFWDLIPNAFTGECIE